MEMVVTENIEHTESGALDLDASPKVSVEEGRVSGVASMLRIVGGAALLGSAVTFGVQRWDAVDAVSRFGLFLGLTVVVAAVGALCVLRLKDAKGARMLLAISAAFLPAHFAQLGALFLGTLYGVPDGLPAFFVLQASDLSVVFALIAVSVPVLGAVAFAGLSSLARTEGKVLAALYMLMNAALLIPTRSATLIAAIAGAAFLIAFIVETRHFMGKSHMKTLEALVARAIVIMPLVVLIGRNMFLYQPSLTLAGAAFAIGSAVAFLLSRYMSREDAALGFTEAAAVASGAAAWGFFANAIARDIDVQQLVTQFGYYGGTPSAPVLYLPIAIGVFAASMVLRKHTGFYRKGAAWLGVVATIDFLFSTGGILASVLCILTAVVALISSYGYEDRGLFFAGVVGMAAGFIFHLQYAIDLYHYSPWLTLAGLGLGGVVISSYLEVNARSVVGSLAAFRQKLESWN